MLTTIAMWLCVSGDGIVLETFLSTNKDEPVRKTLLSAYNSYSGSLTSVFVEPVELFFAMALAVGMLCFATDLSIGEHHAPSRARLVLLVATAATGYLITNGSRHELFTDEALQTGPARHAKSSEGFEQAAELQALFASMSDAVLSLRLLVNLGFDAL